MPPPIPHPINAVFLVNCPDVVYRDPASKFNVNLCNLWPISASSAQSASKNQSFLCKTNPISEVPKSALTPCPIMTTDYWLMTTHDKKRTQNEANQTQFQPKNAAPNPIQTQNKPNLKPNLGDLVKLGNLLIFDAYCATINLLYTRAEKFIWEVTEMNDFSRFTLSAIVCLSVFALAGQSAGSDKTMSFRQHQIERNYAARMSQLYARAEREANKLNVTNRLLWLEFITGDETPYSDSFSLYTVGGGSGSLRFSTSTDIGGEVVTSSVLVASSSENYDTKLTTLTRPQRYLQAHLADSYSLRQFAMFLLSDQSGIVLSDIADSRFQNRRLRNQEGIVTDS
jgi:hypothetical protein